MSHDTLLHRTLRPVVGWLVRTPVTPDVLTLLRLLTGLGAAACFACGPRLMNPGAGLCLVSMLLDRADGELARQSGRFSRRGERLDLISDCVATMAIFVGLGIGAAPAAWRAAGLACGVLAAVATVGLFVQLNRPTPAGAVRLVPSRRFDPDDAMLVVPFAIWAGGASWVLFASGVLTPIAAVVVLGLGWLGRWRDHASLQARIAASRSSRMSHSESVPTVMRR